MTLQHSQTWPVNTVAVVQLRVDPNGRAYSTSMGPEAHLMYSRLFQPLQGNNSPPPSTTEEIVGESESIDCGDGVILPLSKQHLQVFSSMYKISRTDTISTVVEQDSEYETENQLTISNDHELNKISRRNATNEHTRTYDKIQVLALAKIEEVQDETEEKVNIRRGPSIKIDNWDLVFSENNKPRCQIHSNNDNIPVNTNTPNTCGCKSKNRAECNEHTDCLLPEIPLDARKVTTLRRHYYPEGGWGWVIVVCSVLVHVLNNGLQLSCSQLVLPAAGKFKTLPVHVAGKSILRNFLFAL